MEEEISRMKLFLTEFNNEQIESPTSDEIAHLRIGNYALEPEDVTGQVIDWILNYLDNRKCPYSLALSVAKEIAQQISASFPQNVMDAEKVCYAANVRAEAMGKIRSVCNAFSNQANLESICSTKYATSVFAIKNKRRKMEDRHVIHHDLNALLDFKDAPHHSYYAVFDGHSGIEAATYASAQLHVNIAKHPAFFTDTPKAIIEGYEITDLNFLNMCNKWNIKSGCTAVCAFIREDTIFLSWLGDSQAVIVKGGMPLTITKPHKPDREDEKQRIESLGGHVSYVGTWRVNGQLAVTRAIGDPDHKPYVISEPELDIVKLDGTEDFLILACDGLSDTLTPEEITSVLYRYLANSSSEEPIEAVAAKLVHQSKLQGSEDNITAIVIFLRDMKDIKENAIRFLSNPMYCVQNHDFMCMNGNTKIFNIKPDSDAPFSKPTVLELNAASSKKLKNAANVMSSTGFGSASYSYQCVENSAEGSFQAIDPSLVDSAQNIFVSQNISASCFAPEATALSELPTPPIDDILASQQFENFYSTDLYKELNNSLQSSENAQPIDIVNSNVDDNLILNEPSKGPNDDFSPQPSNDNITNVNSMSLLDTESNPIASPDTRLSPDEAVGIATNVVSTAIETAVKCISSSEIQDSSPLQSQLNPYAKPFVMKSFFGSEESESQVTNIVSSEICNTSTSLSREELKLDNQLVSEIATEIPTEIATNISTESDFNQLTTGSIKTTLITDERLNQSITSNTAPENVMDQPLFDDSACDKFATQDSASLAENKLPELVISPEQSAEKIAVANVSESLQDDISKDISIGNMSNVLEKSNVSVYHTPYEQSFNKDLFETNNQIIEPEENKLIGLSTSVDQSLKNENLCPESSLVIENVQTDVMNILPSSEETKNYNLSPFSPGSAVSQSETHEQESVAFTTQSVTSFTESISQLNQNFNLDNVITRLDFEKTMDFSDYESKHEAVEKNIESESASLLNVQVEPQAKTTETTVLTTNFEESNKYELNQNTVSGNASESSSFQNTPFTEAEIQSKCEEIQKSIVKNEVPESSSLIEPISLIDIKGELISTEAEVPSDPPIEDPRVETVAVDLKSLPDGIPEAEGVTEDIDSDSEKDGGWSYMKGNNVSGPKTKLDEKASKTTKTNEVKSNVMPKGKRDILKPNAEKSKVKTAVLDKTKSSVTDKSKNTLDKGKNVASGDKMKTTFSADKIKTTPSADKAKTLVSSDKTKPLISVDKNRKTNVEKKPDVRTRVMKSSTLTSALKATTEKTSRVTATSSIRKETSETSKGTSTATKSTRPTTLLRTTVPATKSTSVSVTDRNTASNKIAAKPKVTTTLSDKTSIKKVASSTLTKSQTSTQSKSYPISTRTPSVRPTSTVPNKTSTISTRAPLVKSAVGDAKLKPAGSTASSSLRKPLTTVAKKSDVKEVKDSVNKEILAKKTSSTKRIESNATLNRKVASANNKSTVNKVSSVTAKSEISRRNLPKASGPKSVAKNAESKVSQDASKSKEEIIESDQCKTDETKNSLNIETGQKNAAEILQVTEEKFILEAINKEKEGEEVSHEEPVENGSFINSATPVEIQAPATECTPESL